MAEAVLRVVAEAAADTRVTIESFDWRGPRHVRRLRPDIPLAWLTRSETVRDAALWWGAPIEGPVPAAVAAEGGQTWAPEHTDLTEPAVAEAHRLGLTVLVWTVNDPAEARRLLAWGVDGIITDYPDMLTPS
jgi:glycerophosphoryl diester phosphodiesterase